jgi:outer membrane receptor protein involved in Fe transport
MCVRLLSPRLLYTRAACAIAGLTVVALTARAEALQGSANFDIPAQPLPSALIEFSRQADVQVMGSSTAYAHLRSQEVKGRLSATDALRRLLRNTGLKYSIFRRAVVVNSISSARDRLTHSVDPGDMPSIGDLDETVSVSRANANYPMPLGNMLVTGTHIRGGDPIGSQVIVMDREDIIRTGYSTVADVVRSLPQAFGGGPSEDTNLGNEGNTSRGTAINLRGLGAGATLVLINGRRVAPSGSQSSFVDVSSIPLTAVARVEVLMDGVSAIYGSDAIGGVVNFIMRDDYQGAETQASLGSVTEGPLQEVTASQLFGTRWSTGHATLSYNYYQRDALSAADRRLTKDSDLRSLGGSNFSLDLANPGNLVVAGRTYAIPRNQNGVGLSPASLVPDTFNYQNLNAGRDVRPDVTVHSAFGSGSQTIGPLTLSGDALYSTRSSVARLAALTAPLVVPVTNPFRVVPSGVSPTARQTIKYSFDGVLGPRATNIDVDTFSAVFGAKLQLPRHWEGTLSLSYGAEDIDQRQSNNFNTSALNAALADPNPLTAFNPYADGNATNPATLDRIRRTTQYSSTSAVRGANLMLDGGLFALPGGQVRLAAGLDYRDQDFQNRRLGADATVASVTPRYARHVKAAFAELQVPLISSRNHIPAVEHLQVSLAGRYDEYNDFGSTWNPRVGAEWAPVRSLAFHGSWGKSYRAPDLPDLDVRNNQTVIADLPDAQSSTGTSPVLAWLGGNADLKAETATTWSAGLNWTPEAKFTPSVDLTYYSIDYRDRLQVSTAADRFLLDTARYMTLTYRNPSPALRAQACGQGVFLGNLSSSPGACTTAPVAALIDLRWNNISELRTNGLDLKGSASIDTDWGQFALTSNINYVLDFSEAASPTAAMVSLVDTVSNPLRFSMNNSLAWSRDELTVSGTVNYDGSYRDNLSIPNRRVGSWTTLDLNVLYAFDASSGPGWLDGCSLTLSVRNVFDTDPPFVNNPSGVGYDRENADLLNRFVSLRFKKEW